MVRGAGCREINPRLRRREKNVLDIPFYRSGIYTHNLRMDEGRKRARVMAAILTVLTWKEPTICSAAQRKAYLQSTLSMLTNAVTVPFALMVM